MAGLLRKREFEELKSLRLGNSGINNLYSWTGRNSNLRALIATTGSTFDFSTTEVPTLSDYDTALRWNSGDADNVVNTLVGGSKPTLLDPDASTPVVNLSAQFVNSTGGSTFGAIDGSTTNGTKFSVGAYTDNPGSSSQDDFALAVNISDGPWRSYDNSTQVNYEIIVPLNGTVGAVDAVLGTTYYFHIKIR